MSLPEPSRKSPGLILLLVSPIVLGLGFAGWVALQKGRRGSPASRAAQGPSGGRSVDLSQLPLPAPPSRDVPPEKEAKPLGPGSTVELTTSHLQVGEVLVWEERRRGRLVKLERWTIRAIKEGEVHYDVTTAPGRNQKMRRLPSAVMELSTISPGPLTDPLPRVRVIVHGWEEFLCIAYDQGRSRTLFSTKFPGVIKLDTPRRSRALVEVKKPQPPPTRWRRPRRFRSRWRRR